MGKVSKLNTKKVGYRKERNRYYARLEKFGGGKPLFKTEAEAAKVFDIAETEFGNNTFVNVVNAKTFRQCVGTYDKDYFDQTQKKHFISGFIKQYQDRGWRLGPVQNKSVQDRFTQLEGLSECDYIDVPNELIGKVKLKKIGDIAMADFELLDIKRSLEVFFHDNKTIKSTSSRDKYVQSLKMIFDWAINEKVIKYNVLKMGTFFLSSMAYEPPVKRRIPNHELDKIVKHIDNPKWQLCVTTGSETGLRPGELAGLHWNEIYWGEGDTPDALSVMYGRQHDGSLGKGKTGAARRTVPLNEDLAAALRRWKIAQPLKERGKGLVFPNSVGEVCDNTKWNARILTPACAKAEVGRITMYDLRHYYASVLIYETSAKDVEIQYWMGHHSVAFTQKVYAHWLNDPRRNRTINVELKKAFGTRVTKLKVGRV